MHARNAIHLTSDCFHCLVDRGPGTVQLAFFLRTVVAYKFVTRWRDVPLGCQLGASDPASVNAHQPQCHIEGQE